MNRLLSRGRTLDTHHRLYISTGGSLALPCEERCRWPCGPHCDPFRVRRRMAHILIIEDYPDTRDVTQLILVDAGHSVSSASDGVRGLYLAARDQPDLILMDLALPRLDGWFVTQRLKAYPLTRH